MITHTFTKQVEFIVNINEKDELGREAAAVMARDPEFVHEWLDGALWVAFAVANARPNGDPGWISVTGTLVGAGE